MLVKVATVKPSSSKSNLFLVCSLQGNQPLAKELRGDMATHEFAALIAPYFPLLPKLENVQEDLDQQVGFNDRVAKSPIIWIYR